MNSTKLEVKVLDSIHVWEICKFWILPNYDLNFNGTVVFERYVNFEFYQTVKEIGYQDFSLRDM